MHAARMLACREVGASSDAINCLHFAQRQRQRSSSLTRALRLAGLLRVPTGGGLN